MNFNNLIQGEELFQHIEDFFFFKKDLNSRFTGANDSFVKVCGAESFRDIVVKTDHDFFPRHIASRYVKDDKKVIQSQKMLKITEVNSSTQGFRWFQTTKIPLFQQGKISGIAGIAKDLKRSLTELAPFDRLQPALMAIEANIKTPLSVPELAKITHLSISQFERLFKKAFEVTPKQYILRLRLDEVALALKRCNASITELAFEYGFHDQSHLSKQFAARFGTSPRHYQKKMKEEISFVG
jgi:AraC-like DNA-binding protein